MVEFLDPQFLLHFIFKANIVETASRNGNAATADANTPKLDQAPAATNASACRSVRTVSTGDHDIVHDRIHTKEMNFNRPCWAEM
uniref:Uncharacterized protein n=1 Tax=Globodera rostochiensis TaxID=31243 RepID=A0A914HZH7_GLORO